MSPWLFDTDTDTDRACIEQVSNSQMVQHVKRMKFQSSRLVGEIVLWHPRSHEARECQRRSAAEPLSTARKITLLSWMPYRLYCRQILASLWGRGLSVTCADWINLLDWMRRERKDAE